MNYVLYLEKEKFYVGYTSYTDGFRINQHFSGDGALWTKKYKPIQCIIYRKGNEEDENKLTLEFMKQYGWWNVRGGNWTKIDIEEPPKELMPDIKGLELSNLKTSDNCSKNEKENKFDKRGFKHYMKIVDERKQRKYKKFKMNNDEAIQGTENQKKDEN